MKFHLFVTAAAGALVLSACGTAEEPEVPAAENTVSPDANAMADPSTPQGFVDAAAASDTYEMEAARVAQEKSQNEAVLEFAQMMIDDHSTSTQNLQQAAGEVQGVTVAPEMTSMQQQQLTRLRAASAEQFDATYKQQQVAAHQQALDLMQTYAESGDAAPLQAFASNTAPVIERHLETANDLP